MGRNFSFLFFGVVVLILETLQPVIANCSLDADSFSGTWTGIQQEKYKVHITFNLKYHPASRVISGTAQFRNADAQFTTEAKILSGQVHDYTGDPKLTMVVLYETGPQMGAEVVFDLNIRPDCSLKGSVVDRQGRTQTLTLNR